MIEIVENNFGRKEIRCPNCDSRLRYHEEDIKTKTETYTVYHNVTTDDTINYIVCPVCNTEIKVNRWK